MGGAEEGKILVATSERRYGFSNAGRHLVVIYPTQLCCSRGAVPARHGQVAGAGVFSRSSGCLPEECIWE